MKQSLIVLTLALAAAIGAHAQDESAGGKQQGPHGTPEERIERMRAHLGLTDEQAEQMREIQASDASRREKREQIHGVLTEEQRNIMREHREQRGGKRHGRPDKDTDNP